MLLVHEPCDRRVEVLSLMPEVFPDPIEAELYVFSGEGGVARIPLWNGSVFSVWRDHVEAICGWWEGSE